MDVRNKDRGRLQTGQGQVRTCRWMYEKETGVDGTMDMNGLLDGQKRKRQEQTGS